MKKSSPRRTDNVTAAAMQLQSVKGVNAMQEAAHGAQQIARVAQQFANAAHVNHTAGRVFEEMHAAIANVDAALKGLPQRFATTASEGQPCAAADLVVKLGGKTVSTAQAKLSESSTALLARVSDKAYDGMQKIVPADKVDTVRTLAEKLSSGGRRPDLNLPDTAAKVSDKLRHAGAASKPVTVAQAQQAARQPQRAGKALETQTANAAYGSAAAMGGALGGVMTLIGGGSAGDASRAAAKGAVRGVAQQAATSGVKRVGTAVLTKVGGKATGALSNTGAGAIAGASIGIATDLFDLANGKIDGSECASRAAKHTVRAGTTWAGAEVGATLGAVGGPVGVLVGGLVGGLVGSLVPDWF